jgi:hypothetical protein
LDARQDKNASGETVEPDGAQAGDNLRRKLIPGRHGDAYRS